MRDAVDGELRAVLVLRTLGALERRRLRGRKGRSVESAEPAAVPTARVTVVRPAPFGSLEEAEEWLAALRGDEEGRDRELAEALSILNRGIHAHRVASADGSIPDLSVERALVARIGIGAGEEVAEGRFHSAWELPAPHRRTRRSMEAPEERFAAILSGRERAIPCEELVLRARADLDAGRGREAALQARVALESLLADLPSEGRDRAELDAHRKAAGDAANAALRGEVAGDLAAGLAETVGAMEAALRRRRLGG